MNRLFYSLQFKLLLGFTLLLLMAMAGTQLSIRYAAKRESQELQERIGAARAANMEKMMYKILDPNAKMLPRDRRYRIQEFLEQASNLYGLRIVIRDQEGRLIGDSHNMRGRLIPNRMHGYRSFNLMRDEKDIGWMQITYHEPPDIVIEPDSTGLVAALNGPLLWAGITTATGSIILAWFFSRRVLRPIRSLSKAANQLGSGDLTQRVTPKGHDEISELGRTFNLMAAELEQSERRRKNLMNDIAHELRTPLSNIQGYLEAIQDKLLEPNSKTITSMQIQITHLTNLVEDVRTINLVEAGDLALELQSASISNLLIQCVESFRPRAKSGEIELNLDIVGHLPDITIDSTRIAQVIINLLDNAVQYTPAGGKVKVLAYKNLPLTINVRISDTGGGIPAAYVDKVFDRFFRPDLSRTRETGGAGLGLTIAKQLVDAHGGSIWIESELDKGTVIEFELPVSPQVQSHPIAI